MAAENFIGVLNKNKTLIDQNKKVLNSTSDDFVFIYFSGHGGPGHGRLIKFCSDYTNPNLINFHFSF